MYVRDKIFNNLLPNWISVLHVVKEIFEEKKIVLNLQIP